MSDTLFPLGLGNRAASQVSSGVPAWPSDGVAVALLGDSITRQNNGGSTGTRSSYQSSRGYFSWLQVLSGFPFYSPAGYDASNVNATIGYNFGIGGDTVVNMAARFLPIGQLDPKPRVCILMAGTNDITGGATDAAIQAAFTSIFNTAQDCGIFLVVMPITPRNNDGAGTSNWTTAQRQQMNRINTWLAYQCQQASPGALFADHRPYLTDQNSANGDAVTGWLIDGLHPLPKSAYQMGLALKNAMATILPGDMTDAWYNPADTFDAVNVPYGNLLTNGNLTGTGGTATAPVTGTVPTSWTCERSSGTQVTATIAPITKGFGINTVNGVEITVTSAGGGSIATLETIRLRTSTTTLTAGVTNNTWYEGGLMVEVDAPSTNDLIRSVHMQLQDVSTNGAYVRCLDDQSTSSIVYPYPNVAWSGRFRTPPLLTVGTTGLRWSFLLNVDPTKAGTFKARVYLPSLRVCRNPAPLIYTTGPLGV